MKSFFQNIAKADIRAIIALLVIFCSYGAFFCLLFIPIPKENESMINVIAGAMVVGGVGAIFGYYFGTSKVQQTKLNDE